MGEHDINATFFDDVRVPAKFLVGEENGGWGSSPTSSTTSGSRSARSGMPERAPHRRAHVGPGDDAARRPPRDRPGVGAAQPRPGARPARVPAAGQLEGRLVGRAGRPRTRPTLRRQGLRHRVLPGGLPAPHGDPRAGVLPQGATRRRRSCGRGSRAASAARSSSPSAAASTRCSATSSPCSASGFPRSAADPQIDERENDMDFSFTSDQEELRGLANRSSPTLHPASTSRRSPSARARRRRPRAVARRSPTPASSASACPSRSAAAASASSRSPSCSRRSAGPPPRSRRSR